MTLEQRHDLAEALAREHIRWARQDGQHPAVIVAALGLPGRWPVTWEDAHDALAMSWLNLGSVGNQRQREDAA